MTIFIGPVKSSLLEFDVRRHSDTEPVSKAFSDAPKITAKWGKPCVVVMIHSLITHGQK